MTEDSTEFIEKPTLAEAVIAMTETQADLPPFENPVWGFLRVDPAGWSGAEIPSSELETFERFLITLNGRPVSMAVLNDDSGYDLYTVAAQWMGREENNPESAYSEFDSFLEGLQDDR